ncbi:hypothetical protein K1719_013742 [Acacia pycnantha]|nr:hypothetical protein K1719_013742 [Acacia pycnantha]
MARSVKVAVIGAGVSGLVAARELQREGHRVVVFEKNHRIAAYDTRTEADLLGIDPNREIIHSSLYLSKHTNLPRQLMGNLDYSFVKRESGDQRTFPGHEEVLRFLDGFAEEFGILELTGSSRRWFGWSLSGKGRRRAGRLSGGVGDPNC